MDESLIRQIPLFADLPDDEVRFLVSSMRLAELSRGEVLFQQGDPGESFFAILEGQVEIVHAMGTTEERVLSQLGPGDHLGELSLLNPHHLRSAAARAKDDSRLLEMSSEDFNRLVKRQAPLAVEFLRNISLRLRSSEKSTIRDLQLKNAELTRALVELQAAQEQLLEKERLEQELRLARSIQENSLPKELPDIPGWQVSAYWQPARQVGGDFYDLIPFKNGEVGIVIGDVTGKGMPAALVMATTRSLLHFAAQSFATKDFLGPGEILRQVNEMCCQEVPPGMFITCLFVVINPKSGVACFANAGHNLPYQYRPGEIKQLRATGMPLGLMPGMEYDERETTLAEGDSLVLYTDGLLEAHNSQREMFGSDRLLANLDNRPEGLALIPYLLDQLVAFTGPGLEQEDDITCLVLERA